MTRKTILAFILLAALLALMGSGCGGNSRTAPNIDSVTMMTEDALTVTLLGHGDDAPVTGLAPPDEPILKKGVYENIVIAADVPAFVKLSGGKLEPSDIKNLTERVVTTVNKRLSRRGFAARSGAFPPPMPSEDKTLVALLSPALEETGSPRDRERGKAKKMVLVRLNITDPKSGTVLSARDYYSGIDVR